MDNIYDQTENERNSIVQIPEKFAENAGNTLYSWLGSLWRSIHKGDDMVRGLQQARGVRLAQLYVNILEAAKLQDRNGAPVFHRELWHPIVIRRSQRNKSQENLLEIGGTEKVIGPQPEGSLYGKGVEFKIGKMANFEKYVTYPVDAEIVGGALSIVDNIIKPAVSMTGEEDYYIRNNTIIFPIENDPLADDSAFERDDLPNIIENDDGTLGADVEAVLWASDVLIDKDYIADHLSYVLGANSPSSDVVKRILNAAWSSTTEGLTKELVQTFLAAMLNVPVIQGERETVIDITNEYDEDDEWKETPIAQIVTTDKQNYRVSPKATLRKNVRQGKTLSRGSLLDETIRIYTNLNADLSTNYSVPLSQDLPSITIPRTILRARTEYGVYAMWGTSTVKKYGSDENHLYFDIGGNSGDVMAFWEDIWEKSDADGTKMSKILGEEGTEICPAEFFLKHLVGANTMFVVIDNSQADDTSMMRNPMFFDMLSDVVPSAMRLFLVEHSSVGDSTNLDETAEKTSIAAALPEAVDAAPPRDERVSFRFVRVAPLKVRGKKDS